MFANELRRVDALRSLIPRVKQPLSPRSNELRRYEGTRNFLEKGIVPRECVIVHMFKLSLWPVSTHRSMMTSTHLLVFCLYLGAPFILFRHMYQSFAHCAYFAISGQGCPIGEDVLEQLVCLGNYSETKFVSYSPCTYLLGYPFSRDAVRRQSAMFTHYMMSVIVIVWRWIWLQCGVHFRFCQPPVFQDYCEPRV